MKSLISSAFGAAALATTAFASPAEARSDVGVYVGPVGVGVNDEVAAGAKRAIRRIKPSALAGVQTSDDN